MTQTIPSCQGAVVTIGGRQYILPPMLFITRQRVKTYERAIVDGAVMDEDDLILTVLLETLKRNYPDLTQEKLLEGATYEELVWAYHCLDLEEARRLAESGKRKVVELKKMATAAMLTSTTSLPESSASLADPSRSGNENLTSSGS